MANMLKKKEAFDITLAKKCASSFSASTQIGCLVSLADGQVVASYGSSCETCRICKTAGNPGSLCVHSHIYGMQESTRFGGKYIYSCPMGLTCFVSPIVGENGVEAKITAGPFLMVERQSYIQDDFLTKLASPPSDMQEIRTAVESVPVIPPERVNDLSELLFMAVGFMNNIWAANNMLDIQESYSIQKQVYSFISTLKGESAIPDYPFKTERALLDSISHLDRDLAGKYLNELFGYIFFSSGYDFQTAKSRIYELLVLISRTAINSGADPEKTLAFSHDYLQIIPQLASMEDLCMWLTKIMNRFMDSLFDYIDVKHSNVIHKATAYIRKHYAEKLTLDGVAREVYLSPAYFSRIFKQETGISFNAFLNNVRVERSKELLKDSAIRLIDISLMVGFNNQSYFTKVFKKSTGVSPLQYREKNVSIQNG